MDVTGFQTLISNLTAEIAGATLDASLEAHLNADHGPGSHVYESVFAACQIGVRDGWLCSAKPTGSVTAECSRPPTQLTASAWTSSRWRTLSARTMFIPMARST